MQQKVSDNWLSFTKRFEGAVMFPYRDQKDLVTIGYGNLIDPIELCDGVEFVREDGLPATHMDIVAGWNAVKHYPCDVTHGGAQFEHVTTLRATEAGIKRLCARKLAEFDKALASMFPQWEAWPAACQTAMLSMCWAMGTGDLLTKFPKFVAACRRADWATAAAECHMSEVKQNASFHCRNEVNKSLFLSAV